LAPKAAASVDSGFTLDEALLAQRKARRAHRLHTLQIPALRTLGFTILCAIVALHGWRSGAPFPQAELVLLITGNLAYAAAAWLLLRAGYGRSGAVDLSLLLLHLDVLMWLPNLYRLEQGGHLFFAYFLLVRVVDQVSIGFKRALYFCAVVTAAYLAYAAWAATYAPAQAFWPERLGIAATMFLLGLYIALTGLVTGRLRSRTQEAMRTARSLLVSLGQKADVLEAQAAELVQARQRAEQADLAKSQFLAVASHELRTPMNGILGAAELLIGTGLSAVQQRYVRIAHRSATALLALIDDVLDLSRIESGQLTLRPEPVDLCALVDEALDLVAVTAREKPVVLSCNVSHRAPSRVIADPQRLRQLLVNLLHNAVKFTERGTVEFTVEPLDDTPAGRRVRFSVRDTGIGIPHDRLASIFDAFEQVDRSTTRRHGGSGVGLAIVKEIVRRWRIWCTRAKSGRSACRRSPPRRCARRMPCTR
jgi:signal transduction histidine kinase